ncbi:MAG: internalin A [Saprospiraceae bacterium]|jgi:internalin A
MQQGTPYRALELIEREMKEQTGTLILSDCGLSEIPREVFEMTWLTELIITNGYESPNIETENISQSTGTFQKNTIDIGEPNHINFIPEEIGRLKDLKKLKIGAFGTSPWAIADISALASLRGLEEVDLSNNQIVDFIPLGELKQLSILKLNQNRIIDIPFFKTIEKLKILELGSNQIEKFNLSIFLSLPVLQSLNLEQNKINFIDFPSNLSSLKELNLNDNELSDLDFLKNINQMEVLFLSRNKIQDIKPLASFSSLKSLELGSNEVSKIGILSKLVNLEILGLSHNQIEDITPLKTLKNISSLFIGDNKITHIEPLIHLQKLEEIYLKGNKIIDCSPDVWQSNDIHQIRAYFEGISRDVAQKQKAKPKAKKGLSRTDLEKNKTRGIIEQESAPAESIVPESSPPEIDDVKLIFVGNSGAGKTQLSKFFENGKLDKTRETTHGIRLNRWLPRGKTSTAFEPLKNKVAVNIWDFGGQEYYHGTFRLFLSNFAVYILLWEADTNQNNILSTEVKDKVKEDLQHYHYKYWLDNIRHYAPTSPILIIQNKVDKDQRHRIDTRWMEDYQISGDHYISLYGAAEASNSPFKWGFDLFCNDLAACFKKILNDEAQQKKSIAWLKVRDAVVEVIRPGKKNPENPFSAHLKTGKYIDLKDFEKACLEIEANLTTSEIYTLPRWLHNSGLVIYFGKDEQLNDKVYLDPVWVTKGIYDVLNNTVRVANGVFSTQDMKSPKGFPKETVLALMREMEIIFEKTDQPDTYVAPQYLPDTHPVEDLYAIAAKGLQQKAYFVRLPLYFFRKVLQRMIFFYGMSPNVDARYYWKKGILFEKKGTRIMFKGIMPEVQSEYGVFLIGAEPVGAYRDIQKEVFHIIAEILDEKELSKIANPAVDKKTIQAKAKSQDSSFRSDIYHRSDNWTESFDEKPKDAPRWLQQMEISVDGENFVNYLKLCHDNREKVVFTESDLKKRLRIHDFELLLDSKPQRPLKVFFSYSHKDTEIMNQLDVHLAPLKRLEKIEVWNDKAIQAGQEWDAAINDNIRDSDIILFLVSADFIASTYIWEKEVPLAFELKKNPDERVSRVIPIYLRPFDFSGLSFAQSEMLPKDPDSQQLKAISQWDNIDEAFMEVAKRIREVIDATV